MQAPAAGGAIETGFPEGDLSFSVRSTRLNIDNYFFKVFTKRVITQPNQNGTARRPRPSPKVIKS